MYTYMYYLYINILKIFLKYSHHGTPKFKNVTMSCQNILNFESSRCM